MFVKKNARKFAKIVRSGKFCSLCVVSFVFVDKKGAKGYAYKQRDGICACYCAAIICFVCVFAVRLGAVPGIVYGVFTLCGFAAALPSAVMMAAMPTGLNTIVYPKSVGRSPALGARMAFISHLLSLLALPFWLSLLQ